MYNERKEFNLSALPSSRYKESVKKEVRKQRNLVEGV
jgi:hypothetical protein